MSTARRASVACGALAFDVRSIAGAAAGTWTCARAARCCTTAPSGSPPAVAEALARATTWWRWPTPTAAPTARWTRCWPAPASRACAGDHCYDVLGPRRGARALAEEPGTYFLTDFLARTFEHTVVRQLGLDRWPELRHTYFAHYTRVVWLAQRPTPATRRRAEAAAERLELPLEIRPVGNAGLERGLERLLAA